MRFFFLFTVFLLTAVRLYPYYSLGATNDSSYKGDFLIPPSPGIDYEPAPVNSGGSVALIVQSAAVTIRAGGGIGQVNTASVDGGLSSHTRIAFEGLVLDFPQNHSFDIGLLPLEFAIRADIYKNNLAPFGINAGGGLIDFRLPSMFVQKLAIELSGGSLNEAGLKLLTALPLPGSQLILGGSITVSQNYYSYIDPSGNPAWTKNLDFWRYSLIAKWGLADWNMTAYHTGKAGGAGTKYPGLGRQTDFLTAISLGWNSPLVSMQASYQNWVNRFTNSIGMDDTHTGHTLNASFALHAKPAPWAWELKAASTTYFLDSTKLGVRWIEDVGLTGGISLAAGGFEFAANLHTIWRIGAVPVPVPGFSAAWKPADSLKIYAGISRHYRPPTMNDLYWPYDGYSSGNTNLTPEDGIALKGGIVFAGENLLVTASAGLSGFTSLILWKPDSFGVWSPGNTGTASAFIAELFAQYLWNSGMWQFRAGAGMSLNRTVNSDEASPYFGKRVIYTPLYKLTFTSGVSFGKDFSAELAFRAVSERFTDELNAHWLEPYYLLDLSVRYLFLTVSLNNILNIQYSEQEGYPLPGFNLKAALTFEI